MEKGSSTVPVFSTMIVIAVIAIIAAHAAIVRMALRMFEYSPPLNVDETQPDPRAEVVYFPTPEGETLAAALYQRRRTTPRPVEEPVVARALNSRGIDFDTGDAQETFTQTPCRGLVLFCHELSADKWSAMKYCEGLWNAGFDILALDFRSHGQSEADTRTGPMHWLTTNEVIDVQAALRFIADHPDLSQLPLGLFGVSRGGGAALVAGALDERVQAVCTDGAYTTHSMTRLYARRWLTLIVPAWMARLIPEWHVSMTIFFASRWSEWRRCCRYVTLEKSLPQLKDRPVLLINGKRDTYVLPEIARSIYDSIGGEERSLWIVPDAKHNQARTLATEHYDERLVEFFSILSESPSPVSIAAIT